MVGKMESQDEGKPGRGQARTRASQDEGKPGRGQARTRASQDEGRPGRGKARTNPTMANQAHQLLYLAKNGPTVIRPSISDMQSSQLQRSNPTTSIESIISPDLYPVAAPIKKISTRLLSGEERQKALVGI
ncbi:hypothetical protein N7517_008161 [Penicillium concentricum]|uniref:Uncharacterized protein n=1 Tax=Penicillium concentricum TaxID=293559 RepID=A0A9W9V3L5_9EURO|nr:uncharacterized protein N7517_008161 [Penicillium concentricum]KAJ5365275.1 hypothetical protein N7517_008161 [Penicillium concentricum]